MSGRPGNAERGTAMLLALVILAVASGLLVGLTGLGRTAVGSASVAVERSRNAVLLESAVQAVIPELFDADLAESLGERISAREVNIGGETVEVRVADICGRWDLNHGDLDVLSEMLAGLGLEKVRASAVVELVRAARSAREPFVDVSQLLVLPGLGRAEREHLKSRVTVQCRAGFVDSVHSKPDLAAAVERAERRSGKVLDGRGGGRTWQLSAEHETGPGTLVALDAVIALSHDVRRPFRILEWRSSE
ncbi:hypothetical protein NUH88_14540 [Nisaea acidiphila]|uniref:General secretion pathway protein GspK n=1 Tax=Nisaea acidiphila TaxID=1862145 RepID=A0A9J7AME2_9PROT|nr:hypothetical protein [Nisaea acidiphila]UUX48624.1 hypothetical protein NUH88_14540 [Nisaea acidiphila]